VNADRPRALEELQVEFDRAASEVLGGRTRVRLVRRPLSAAVALTMLLVLAAAAAAAILITSGEPLPAPHVQDLLSSGVPLPASAKLAGLDAPDPQGGEPPWDVRLSHTADGETCTAVGQVVGGRFGIVGLDRVFRPLPLGASDACSFATPRGPLLAGARVFVGADEAATRTVLAGVAGAGARSVTAYGPQGARTLPLGPDGSFIAVYRGYPEAVRPRIAVVGRDGIAHTVSFAQGPGYEVPDPEGHAWWQAGVGADLEPGAAPDEDCVSGSRRLSQTFSSFAEIPSVPNACGRLGNSPLFVAMRRFDPGTPQWGENPARTIVYGVADPRVAELSLSGGGVRQTLSIDRHNGVFMAVLDGHVDPRALTLSARLTGSTTVSYSSSSGLLSEAGGRVPQLPVQPYRSPVAHREQPPPPFDIPIAGSLRTTAPQHDPAGGPSWVLRSWRGTANSAAHFGGPTLRLVCFQVGVLRNGVLSAPSDGTDAVHALAPPGAAAAEEGCNQQSEIRGPRYGTQPYVANPEVYAPAPVRTVLSGVMPTGAKDVMLFGAGPPRPLQVDSNGAFLAVLPGRYWHSWLHLAYRLHGRERGMGDKQPLSNPPTPLTPQARTPDPDGSAPWGFALGANGVRWIGQIVDGRLAALDELTGTVTAGGEQSGAVSAAGLLDNAPSASAPVTLEAEPVGIYGERPGLQPPPPSRPQIEWRSLPGRTIVTGVADADVVSVTLAMPSDVRTVRPSGPRHVFIVVYDGVFYTGTATATVLLRDGRSVVEALPDGFWESRPEPTPRRELFLAKREVALFGANPARPSRNLPGAEQQVRAIERRIAYERAHPGLLPG
jgi:hypothetical protein